jgi:hypothetical protein
MGDGTGIYCGLRRLLLFNFFSWIVYCSREWFGGDSSHLLTRAAFTILVTSPPLLPLLPSPAAPACRAGESKPARPSALCAHPTSHPIRKGGDLENYEFIPRVQNGLRLRSKNLLARLSLPLSNPPLAL